MIKCKPENHGTATNFITMEARLTAVRNECGSNMSALIAPVKLQSA